MAEYFGFVKEVHSRVAAMRTEATGKLVGVVTVNDLLGVNLFGDGTFRDALSLASKAAAPLYPGWPSQDIRSLHKFLALVNHPFIAPSICIAHTIAVLLHDSCAIYDPPPDFSCVCHTPYNIGNGNIV